MADQLISKYGLKWDSWLSPLEIEFQMIQHGGIIERKGKKYGEGLFQHYRNAQTIRWPEEDHHRWSDLILKTILEERLTVTQGSRDSSKTRTYVKWALIDYWCFPHNTLFLISSTDVRGLELRVWGDIKDLWDRNRDKFDWLQGNPVDSKHGIFTDALDETGDIRDMRKGIICVPVLDSEGNETKLLEKFVGVKQKRRRVICDEAQFLPARYLSILANVDKGDFKSGFTGNPLGQKALDRVAEPECGWANFPEPTKTATWRNKFDGVTINLVGTDSPNFDIGRPKDYDYLINADDARRVEKRFGKDSIEFYSQIMGVRKSGLNPRIVLTPEMCKVNGAYDQCLWGHEEITNVLGIDAGFGGDACETSFIQFGNSALGNPVIKFHEPEIIPINLNDPSTPEDQIAIGAKKMCQRLNAPFTNVYFEAGMRATLAISLARILGNEVNAVNAGGPATERPVSSDLFVDDETRFGAKRLKRCDEHYSKFITEMWFMVRLLVECRQARELPTSVVKEFSEREWIWARGNRYELETKEDFKLRCHYSPNKADATAIAVEGARRLGFDIARVPTADIQKEQEDWLAAEVAAHRKLARKGELNYAG
jgi:hypothetical protein